MMLRDAIQTKLRLAAGALLGLVGLLAIATPRALADTPAWVASVRPALTRVIEARQGALEALRPANAGAASGRLSDETHELKNALFAMKTALETVAPQVQGSERGEFYAFVLMYCEMQTSWLTARSAVSNGRGLLQEYEQLKPEMTAESGRALLEYLNENGDALHLDPLMLQLELTPSRAGKVKIQVSPEALRAFSLVALSTRPSANLLRQQLKVGVLKSMALSQAGFNSLLYPEHRVALPESARESDDLQWVRSVTQQARELVDESNFRRKYLDRWIDLIAASHPLEAPEDRSVPYGQQLANLEYELLSTFRSHHDVNKAPNFVASTLVYLTTSPRGDLRKQFVTAELTRSAVSFAHLRGEALKRELTEVLIAAEIKFFKTMFGCHFLVDKAGAASHCLNGSEPSHIYELDNGWTRAELTHFNEMVVSGWRGIYEAHPISDELIARLDASVSEELDSTLQRLGYVQRLIGGARKLKELETLFLSLPTDLSVPSTVQVGADSFGQVFGGEPIPGYVMIALNQISPVNPADRPWMMEALKFVSGKVSRRNSNREAWAGVLNNIAPAIAQQANELWELTIEGHSAQDVADRLSGREGFFQGLWDRTVSAATDNYDESLPTLVLDKNPAVKTVADARARLLAESEFSGSSIERQIDVLRERLSAGDGARRHEKPLRLLQAFSSLFRLADSMGMAALRSQVRDVFVQCMSGDVLGIYQLGHGVRAFEDFLGARREWLQALFAPASERTAAMYSFLSNGHVLKQYTGLVMADVKREFAALTYLKRQENTQAVPLFRLINALDDLILPTTALDRSALTLPLRPLLSAAMLRFQQSSSVVDAWMNDVRTSALHAPEPVSNPNWEPEFINAREYHALARVRATLPAERERKERLTLLIVSAALEPYLRTYARDNARGFGDLLSGSVEVNEMLQRSTAFAQLSSVLTYTQGEAMGQMVRAQTRWIDRLESMRSITEQFNHGLFMAVSANMALSSFVPATRWLDTFLHSAFLVVVPADLALNITQVNAYAREYGNIGSFTSAGFMGEGVVDNDQVEESMNDFLRQANGLRERLPMDALFLGGTAYSMVRAAMAPPRAAHPGSGPGYAPEAPVDPTLTPAGRNIYEVMGVNAGVTESQLRSAYRRSAHRYHPDRAVQQGVSPEAARANWDEFRFAYLRICELKGWSPR